MNISKDWKYFPEEDRYVHESGFQVSGLYIKDYTKNWGRPVEITHIYAILEKLRDEYEAHKALNSKKN